MRIQGAGQHAVAGSEACVEEEKHVSIESPEKEQRLVVRRAERACKRLWNGDALIKRNALMCHPASTRQPPPTYANARAPYVLTNISVDKRERAHIKHTHVHGCM